MNSEPLNEQTFIAQMLVEIPELQPVYDEHMRFYRDELLSHLLMWEVTQFIVNAYNRSTTADPDAQHLREVVDRTLAFMEQAITSSDYQVWNLIVVSFLENLLPVEDNEIKTDPDDNEVKAYKAIKLLLGPKLREQLEKLRQYWDFPADY